MDPRSFSSINFDFNERKPMVLQCEKYKTIRTTIGVENRCITEIVV